MAGLASATAFDQNDSKYKCCCKSIHVLLGAKIITVASIAALAINLIFSTVRNSTVALNAWTSMVFAAAIYACLCWGVFKQKKIFLIPYLIFQAIAIVTTTITILVFLIGAAANASFLRTIALAYSDVNTTGYTADQENDVVRNWIIVIIVFMFIMDLIQLWFLDVIYRCYTFFKDRETSFNFPLENGFQTNCNVNVAYGTGHDIGYGMTMADTEFPPNYIK